MGVYFRQGNVKHTFQIGLIYYDLYTQYRGLKLDCFYSRLIAFKYSSRSY